jgi:hypothetical protein
MQAGFYAVLAVLATHLHAVCWLLCSQPDTWLELLRHAAMALVLSKHQMMFQLLNLHSIVIALYFLKNRLHLQQTTNCHTEQWKAYQ